MLHAEQNWHGECDPAPGQDDREPEKRTAQKIKGIRADKVDAQVGVPVPAKAAAADSVIRQIVKRDLLGVIVAVVDIIAAVCNDNGQNDQQETAESQQECQKIAAHFIPEDRAAECDRFHGRDSFVSKCGLLHRMK